MTVKEIVNQYLPLPQQSRFHKSLVKFRCYLGGLGSGKTRAGAEELLLILLENPGIIFLVARQTYPELRDTTLRVVFDVIPVDLIKSWNKSENHLVLKNGSEVLFRSLDDPMKLKSLEIGGFWIDEASEVSEDIFLTLQGRLRQNIKGMKFLGGFLTTNPPNVGHWIERYFKDIGLPDYDLIQATTYENKINLPDGYIDGLERNYPAQWIKKYLYGEFGFTQAGLPVFPMFREDFNVKDLRRYWKDPDQSHQLPQLVIYRGWDFGFNHPACLWTAVDSKGRWLWLKELIGRAVLVNDFARKVKLISAQEFPNCQFLDYCDPAGDQKSDKSTETSIQILRSEKIFPLYRKSSPLKRSETMGRLMTKMVDGLPALMVDRGCKVAVDALSGGYHFKRPSDNEKFQQDMIDKDGFYEHIMDAGGYIADWLFDVAVTGTRPLPTKIGNFKDFKRYEAGRMKVGGG